MILNALNDLKHNILFLFTVKQKYNEIFIAEGNEVHISKKESHVAYIHQSEGEKINTVSLKDIKFHCSWSFFN